jgi:TolB-like protein/Flp pilus assembly protein TadD
MLVVGGWLALASRSDGADGTAEASVAQPEDERPSIAVLPFGNLSGDPANQPFTDGIHGDIILQLSKIGSLKVISRTSVQEYRSPTKSVPEIADELGVGHVLEGEVQRAGDQFRINVQLIDSDTDAHMWSEQYGGELTVANIFSTQSEIATAITDALRATLTQQERAAIARLPTEDLEAYETYTAAMEYFRSSYSEANFRAADLLASQAIERDSSFAEAYALRAATGSMLYWFFFERSDSAAEASYALARRALELQPGLAEGHWALAHWYYRTKLDYDRALEEIDLALRTGPTDAEMEELAGSVLRRKGDMESAVLRYKRAHELDPRSTVAAFSVGETLTLLRQYEEAETWLKDAIEIRPDFGLPYMYLANVRMRSEGDTAGARAWLERKRDLGLIDDQHDLTLRDLYLWAGFPDAALDELRAGPVDSGNQFQFTPATTISGRAWLLRGDTVRARAAFDSARVQLEALLAADPTEPRYRSALGIALAGLGRAEEAIREGREGVRLMPPAVEAWRGTYRVLDLARIYAMTGRTADAVDQLAYLLSIPSEISVWDLRIDPMWEPLRGNARFEELARIGSIERKGPPESEAR